MDRGPQPSKMSQMVVVDTYDYDCSRHRVVLARAMDTEHQDRKWSLFLVLKPTQVEIFDNIQFYPGDEDTMRVYLCRNDKLKFRVATVRMPQEVAIPIMGDLPYNQMYGEGLIIME